MSSIITSFWNDLQNIGSQIGQFFNNFSQGIQQAGDFFSNLGNAIVGAFTAFASAVYGAFKKLADAVEGFAQWLYNGLVSIGNSVVNALTGFGAWIWQGLQSIGSGILNAFRKFGEWLYNGIVWLANQIYNILKDIWNLLVSIAEYLWNLLVNTVQNIINTLNAWFTGIICNIREKLALSISNSISIYFSWKWGESAVKSGSFKKLLGLPLVYVGSFFAGYIISSLIDSQLPKCGNQTFQIIPPISLPPIKLPRITGSSSSQSTSPNITISLPSTFVTFNLQQAQTTNISVKLPDTLVQTTVTQPQSYNVSVTDVLPLTSATTSVSTAQSQSISVTDELPTTSVSTSVSSPTGSSCPQHTITIENQSSETVEIGYYDTQGQYKTFNLAPGQSQTICAKNLTAVSFTYNGQTVNYACAYNPAILIYYSITNIQCQQG